MSAKQKLTYLLLLLGSIGIVILIWKNGVAGQTVQITESPQGGYKVEVVKRRFIAEDAVYLNAYRGGDCFILRKLLFTGDFLDSNFQDLYPTYSWISENTLQIGQGSVPEKMVEVSVANETETHLSYLLLETFSNKLVIFDTKPNSLTRLGFSFSDRFSCQGQTVTGYRFGAGVELMNASAKPRRVDIRIAKGTKTTISSDQSLKASSCCAADRPDIDHEWLY